MDPELAWTVWTKWKAAQGMGYTGLPQSGSLMDQEETLWDDLGKISAMQRYREMKDKKPLVKGKR